MWRSSSNCSYNKILSFSSPRRIHSVQGLTDLKKITPQQLITCFFIFYFYTLRPKINNQFLDETCIQLLDPSIVITVEAYISLLMLNCLEVWTSLRPFLPDLTFPCILYGSIGQRQGSPLESYFFVLSTLKHSKFIISKENDFLTFKIYC